MFNEKLINLRKQNNDTQESLANRLHVSRSLIAKWEQGKSFPNINDLENLCEIYNITFESLLSSKELKEIYGIIKKKDKLKNILIIALISIASLFIILFFTSPLFVTHSKATDNYEDFRITNYETEYIDNKDYFIMTLDNGETLKQYDLINNNVNIMIRNEKYSNISYSNCKSGTMKKVKTNTYNGYNNRIKTKVMYDYINFDSPTISQDEEIIGLCFDLDPNASYTIDDNQNITNFSLTKDSVGYFYFNQNSDNNLFTSNLIDSFTVKTSFMNYYNISYYDYLLTMNMDIKAYLNNIEKDSISIRIYYIYAGMTIKNYKTNVLSNFTKSTSSIFFSSDNSDYIGWKVFNGNSICNCTKKYLSNDVSQEHQNDIIYFDFSLSISNNKTPKKYEIKSFDKDNNYLGMQTVTNLEEAKNYVLPTNIAYAILIKYNDDTHTLSTYEKNSICFYFTNFYGINEPYFYQIPKE